MKTKRINGTLFAGMVKNGLANLCCIEEKLNMLNVFPVADGDTGSNMHLTLENGIRAAQPAPELGVYLKGLSEGMLYGARGNSGVILSQLFRGLYLELGRYVSASPGELRNAFIRAYKVAYASVVRPVEGTILTVAREGIEHIRTLIDRSTTVEMLLSMYVAEMQKSLSYTPELLPELKEAGVVDSGAMGFIAIVEGMLKYLYGELLTQPETAPAPAPAAPGASVDLSLFNEDSVFEDGYCMEFILQLLRDPRYTQRFRVDRYIEELSDHGGSLVVVQDGKRVKVHIHTLRPAKVIALSQDYGEFLTFKLENMQVQHNEHTRKVRKDRKHVPLEVIAVVNGEGMGEIFTGVGCSLVLDGGASMNTSAQEFVDAFRQTDADRVVVLPNNKNSVLAARQAAMLSDAKNVTVIPTGSVVEGYFALAMDVADSDDLDFRLRQMTAGAENVVTLAQATAARHSAHNGIECAPGDEIALIGDEVVAVSDDWLDVLMKGFAAVPDMEEREGCVIFRGYGVEPAREEELRVRLGEAYPLLEVDILDGGQGIFPWLIGIF